MAITRGFNRPRRVIANPRAIAVLTVFAQANQTGPVNFDRLYRHLMENGFQPNEAHLAVESYLHSARGKRM